MAFKLLYYTRSGSETCFGWDRWDAAPKVLRAKHISNLDSRRVLVATAGTAGTVGTPSTSGARWDPIAKYISNPDFGHRVLIYDL